MTSISLNKQIWLIPHTHLDLGWLKTIDQYYDQQVSQIISSVLSSLGNSNLLKNMNQLQRKFVFAETGYLKMYLNKNPSALEQIKKLIVNKQLEFLNGGMCLPDFASPNYEDLINNFFYGLRYLQQNFNRGTKIGWEIDQFGISQTSFFVLKLLGFTDAVLIRIPQQIKNQFKENKTLQFKYLVKKLNEEIRVHVGPDHYSSPKQLDRLHFKQIPFDQQELNNYFETNNQYFRFDPFYFLGDDFTYTKAEEDFKFYDQVISTNKHYKYGLFSEYLKQINEKNFPIKTLEDFYVYTDNENLKWSGFFTTKPRLKFKIKRLGQIIRQMFLFFGIYIIQNQQSDQQERQQQVKQLIDLMEDYCLLIHHDTITGTSTELVDENSFKRIQKLEQSVDQIYGWQLEYNLAGYDFNDHMSNHLQFNLELSKKSSFYFVVTNFSLNKKLKLIKIGFDNYQENKSIFQIFKISKTKKENVKFNLIYYQRLNKCVLIIQDQINSFQINQYQILIKKIVQKEKSHLINYQVNKITLHKKIQIDNNLLEGKDQLNDKLIYKTSLKKYKNIQKEYLKNYKNNQKNQKKSVNFVSSQISSTIQNFSPLDLNEYNTTPDYFNQLKQKINNPSIQNLIQNQNYQLDFSDFSITISNNVIFYQDKRNQLFLNKIQYLSIDSYKSGHYILKYELPYQFKPYGIIQSYQQIRGSIIQGVIINYDDLILTLSKSKNQNFYQIETLIKKSETLDRGADILLQIKNPNINSLGQYFTDSNGLDEIQRNFNDEIEASVFPVSQYISIRDQITKQGLYVFNDRCQGGISKESGAVILYLQRSASQEDHKGVEEVLRVKEDIYVQHYVYNYNEESKDFHEDVNELIQETTEIQQIFILKDNNKKQKIINQQFFGLIKETKKYEQIKLNVDFINENEFILRIQNISKFQTVQVKAEELLVDFLGIKDKLNLQIKEVKFCYYVDKECSYTKDIKSNYSLKSFGYLSLLVRLK